MSLDRETERMLEAMAKEAEIVSPTNQTEKYRNTPENIKNREKLEEKESSPGCFERSSENITWLSISTAIDSLY